MVYKRWVKRKLKEEKPLDCSYIHDCVICQCEINDSVNRWKQICTREALTLQFPAKIKPKTKPEYSYT